MAGDADTVDESEHPEFRAFQVEAARDPAREARQHDGEKRQAHEGVRDVAMIFDNRYRIARQGLEKDVDIGENGAEDCGKNCDAMITLREICFTEERTCNSVGYRVHERSAKTKSVHDSTRFKRWP